MGWQAYTVRCSRLFMCVCGSALAAAAQVVERASVDSGGAQANQASRDARTSADGRFVVFTSNASNLVASDTNGVISDIFVRDRVLGTTELVSVSSAGQQSTSSSQAGAISADGRYVAFLADALDVNDTDGMGDVYLRDRTSGTTTMLTPNGSWTMMYSSIGVSFDGHRVSYGGYDSIGNVTLAVVVDHTTGQSWQWSGSSPGVPYSSTYYTPPYMSGNGRYVYLGYSHVDGYGNGYDSVERFDTLTATYKIYLPDQYATPGAVSRNGLWVVIRKYPGLFRLDATTGTLDEITVTTNGAAPNGPMGRASISDDGRYVAFTSNASNLVAGDTNGTYDAFVRDCVSRVTVRVSESAAGAQANNETWSCDLTGDGALVLFDSLASNLLTGDTNGFYDVFTRTNCFQQYPDADGDGFGAMVASQLVCVPTAGWSLRALDCDDTNASRHPGAPDLLNGFDDDCDGTTDEDALGAAYCTAGTSPWGCVPQISAFGVPSAGASSGYSVVVQTLPVQRSGMILYGLAPAATPWGSNGTSYSCVAPPHQRTAAISTGGTSSPCTGQLALDVPAWSAAHPSALGMPLQAGQTLYFQGWYRDQGAPKNSSLSAGWVVTFGP